MTRRTVRWLSLLLLFSGVLSSPWTTQRVHGAPEERPVEVLGGSTWDAGDPDAVVITDGNVGQHEAFWPYQVRLTEAIVSGQDRVKAGVRGVLVRIGDDGLARIDFGRDGVHSVPLEKTNAVEQANAIRLGKEGKLAPNLTHAIGPRLIDASASKVRGIPFESTFRHPGFLSVYASPDDLDELVAALAPLEGRYGVRTVLFPAGRQGEVEIHRRLRELDWKVAFLPTFLAEGYTEARLAEGIELPAVQLETREGRLLFGSAWSPEVPERLEAALQAAFGGEKASADVPDEASADVAGGSGARE